MSMIAKVTAACDGDDAYHMESLRARRTVLSAWATRTIHEPTKRFGSHMSPSYLTYMALSPPKPPFAAPTMSRFPTAGDYISRVGFAHLPAVGDIVPRPPQLKGSVTSGRAPGISTRRASQLQGDLVTGTIDITYERAYMLSVIRGEDRTEGTETMACGYFSLSD
jgi:hypothetical protein